jgi:hypothetical protein
MPLSSRFRDFVVREIDVHGTVARLTSLQPGGPADAAQPGSGATQPSGADAPDSEPGARAMDVETPALTEAERLRQALPGVLAQFAELAGARRNEVAGKPGTSGPGRPKLQP